MSQDSIGSIPTPPLVSEAEPIKTIDDTVICGRCYKRTKESECALLRCGGPGILFPVCQKCIPQLKQAS